MRKSLFLMFVLLMCFALLATLSEAKIVSETTELSCKPNGLCEAKIYPIPRFTKDENDIWKDFTDVNTGNKNGDFGSFSFLNNEKGRDNVDLPFDKITSLRAINGRWKYGFAKILNKGKNVFTTPWDNLKNLKVISDHGFFAYGVYFSFSDLNFEGKEYNSSVTVIQINKTSVKIIHVVNSSVIGAVEFDPTVSLSDQDDLELHGVLIIPPPIYEGYLKFDLSSIPSLAVINSATLGLYGNSDADPDVVKYITVTIYNATAEWTESNTSAQIGAITQTSTGNSTFINYTTAQWQTFNITNAVIYTKSLGTNLTAVARATLSHPTSSLVLTNVYFIEVADFRTPNAYFNFSSSENSQNIPYLNITYTQNTVTFVSPTPNNGSTVNNNWIYANVSSIFTQTSNHSVLLDWNDSLITWLPLDYYNATAFTDNFSAYGINGSWKGTNFNMSNLTTGPRGNALTFDGSDDYLDAGNNSILNNVNNKTIAFWVKSAAFGMVNQFFFTKVTGVTLGDKYYALIPINRKIYWNVMKNGAWYTRLLSTTSIQNNTWYHLAFTFDGQDALIYINGVNQTTTAGTWSVVNTSIPLRIGSNPTGGTNFNGTMDEFTVFNRTLSSAEILALYNATANQYYNNFTNLGENEYDFKAYGVDENGVFNNSEKRMVYVNLNPSAFQWQSFNKTNSSGFNGETIQFFANFTNDWAIGEVNLTFQNTNYTMALWNGSTINGVWNYNISGLGVDTYYFNYTARETTSTNTSQTFSLVISKADVNITEHLNGTSNNKTYPFGSTINASGRSNVSSLSLTLYRNGTSLASGSNPESLNTSLSAGSYNFSACFAGNTNYSSSCREYIATVSINSLNLTLHLNDTLSDKLYIYGDIINASGQSNTSFILRLLRNGTIIANSSTPTENNVSLAAGDYNYTLYWQGNENYSTASQTWFANISKRTTNVTLHLNGSNFNVDYFTGETVNATGWKNTTQGELWLYRNGTVVAIDASLVSEINQTCISACTINYTLYVAATENYSSAMQEWWANFIVSNFAPQFLWQQFNLTNGSSFVSPLTVQFFSSWSDDNGTSEVNFTFQDANYTMVLWNGSNTNGVWNYNISGLAVGIYYFNYTATDGALANSSSTYSLVIAKTAMLITFLLNNSASDKIYILPATVNASAWKTISESNLTLYYEGSEIAFNQYYVEISNQSLGLGVWNYTVCSPESQNYSFTCSSLYATMVLPSVTPTITTNIANIKRIIKQTETEKILVCTPFTDFCLILQKDNPANWFGWKAGFTTLPIETEHDKLTKLLTSVVKPQ